jgi:DNA-binding Xre family transcriptional regulator
MTAEPDGRRRGLRVNPNHLERALTDRAWEGQHLARAAGVSVDTITRLRSGRGVDRSTLLKVVAALDQAPINRTIAELTGA